MFVILKSILTLLQVQHYIPKTRTKYEPLPENIEAFFTKDVSELVSNKLPGYQVSPFKQTESEKKFEGVAADNLKGCLFL